MLKKRKLLGFNILIFLLLWGMNLLPETVLVANEIQTKSGPTELIEPAMSFYGVNPHDERVGYYVSGAGDVNADGFGDFMVAAYHHDSHGWNCGGVYLFLGAKDIQWAEEEPMSRADAIFKGSREYEMVGYNIDGKGDFNGDGYDDMLIGAPGTWETDSPNPGLLYIVLGKAETDWGDDFLLADGADISYRGEADDDQLGYAVNYIGDLNQDGFDDVIVSAAFKTIGRDTWTGKVYVILGKNTDYARNIPILNEAVASFVYPSDEGTLGFSVAGVGDVNADGYPDFVMTAKGIGTSFLMFGRPEVDWGHDFHLANADVIFTPENRKDLGGWQVKGLGDVNDDGIADFGITGVELHYNFGKVYMILGREEWPAEFSFRDVDASYIGEGARDDAGMSIDAVGDYDGDGIDDFIFGARYHSRDWPHQGKEYFIRGKKTGWQRDLDLTFVEDYYTVEDSIYCLGWGSAGVDDYNGDTRPDFIVSAPFNSNHGLHWNGRIYLFLGDYPLYYVSGNVTYGDTDQRVQNVGISLSGEENDFILTDENGAFEYPLKPNLDYRLTPSREPGENVPEDCISAFDAALVARNVLGLEKLNSIQLLAADVNLDETISMFDAALILREAVALPGLPQSHVKEWGFHPEFYLHQPITGDHQNENFTAIVRGDVDFDWQPDTSASFGKNLAREVKIPARLQANIGEIISVPLTLSRSQKLLALELKMSYNPAAVEFAGIHRANPLSDWTEAANNRDGEVNLAMYGTQWIDAAGDLLTAQFRVKKRDANISIEKFKINNQNAQTAQISIEAHPAVELPQTFQVHQNYPNPFNGKTAIQFDLPQAKNVTFTVFNTLGQEVFHQTNVPYTAGSHVLTWSGKDFQGQMLPAGIYYYVITAGNFREVKKLMMLP